MPAFSSFVLTQSVLSLNSQEMNSRLENRNCPYNYYFDHPLIEVITGYEEPLKHIQTMSYIMEDIDTKFHLYSVCS